MYKNLSEIAVHKKVCDSKWLFLKNIFSFQVTVFNRREQFFFESKVFLYFIKVGISRMYLTISRIFLEYFLDHFYIRDVVRGTIIISG